MDDKSDGRNGEDKSEAKRVVINQEYVDEEKPYRMASAVAFVLVMIVFGVPMWWHTTKVYRAAIPHGRIQNLESQRLRIPILIRIGYSPGDFNVQSVSTISEILFGNLQDLQIHAKLKLDFLIDIIELVAESKGSSNLIIDSLGPTDSFVQDFILISGKSWNKSLEKPLYFGPDSVTFVRFNPDKDRDLTEIAKLIEKAIVEVTLDVEGLRTVIGRDLKERQGNVLERMTEKEQTRLIWESATLPSKQQIDLVFIIPEPSKCDPFETTATVAAYLTPFIDRLFPVTQLTIHSENLYYVDLAVEKRRDEKILKNAHILDADKLPLLVNPLERYLTTVESTAPVFRLLVYFSSDQLYIVTSNGQPVANNSFVVASWGGLTIVNNCTSKNNISSSSSSDHPDQLQKTLATVLVSQLRILLGLEFNMQSNMSEKSDFPLTIWELNRLKLRSLVDNVLRATGTLTALDKLLDTITNIVISDEIASRVLTSVEALEMSFERLKSEEFGLPLDLAKTASQMADRAFFDPTLLALLYFPDDQKYAIYIPLFLPIGIPVLFSLKTLYTYYFSRLVKK